MLAQCIPQKDKCPHSKQLGAQLGKTTAEIFAIQGRSMEEARWYVGSVLKASDKYHIDHKCFLEAFKETFVQFYAKFKDEAKRCKSPNEGKPNEKDCPCCGAMIRKYRATIDKLKKQLQELEEEEAEEVRKKKIIDAAVDKHGNESSHPGYITKAPPVYAKPGRVDNAQSKKAKRNPNSRYQLTKA